MRIAFREFYEPTVAEHEAIWTTCTFAFDSNTLLHLYGYSEKTANTYLAVLQLLQSRIWLPHQAGLEYHKNRPKVIVDGINSRKKTIGLLQAAMNPATGTGVASHLPEKLSRDLWRLIDEAIQAVKDESDRLQSMFTADPIRDRLDKCFQGKVGPGFSDDDLQKLYIEGEKRFKDRIPPGFKDEGKNGPAKYGDFVIWRELLRKSESANAPLVYVTNDGKEDWVRKFDDFYTVPLPDLRREFSAKSKQDFYLYTSEEFLRHADKFLAGHVDRQAIEELADASQRDRLLSFESGHEQVCTSFDEDAMSDDELATLNYGDANSEEYGRAVEKLRLSRSEQAKAAFTSHLNMLSPGARQARELIYAEIQQLLAACRSQKSWDSRSEYKLPQWLEHESEDMIEYTSIPKMIRIRQNLRRYLKIHADQE